MRQLLIGLPKITVSTVASGNVAPYVGPYDIAMMYSVVDLASLRFERFRVHPGVLSVNSAKRNLVLRPVDDFTNAFDLRED